MVLASDQVSTTAAWKHPTNASWTLHLTCNVATSTRTSTTTYGMSAATQSHVKPLSLTQLIIMHQTRTQLKSLGSCRASHALTRCPHSADIPEWWSTLHQVLTLLTTIYYMGMASGILPGNLTQHTLSRFGCRKIIKWAFRLHHPPIQPTGFQSQKASTATLRIATAQWGTYTWRSQWQTKQTLW